MTTLGDPALVRELPTFSEPELGLTVGTKVRIEKGCKALDVAKNTTATVVGVHQDGPDYGHTVTVVLQFRNGFLAGKKRGFTARHKNRLSDPLINLNDGNPLHRIQIRKV